MQILLCVILIQTEKKNLWSIGVSLGEYCLIHHTPFMLRDTVETDKLLQRYLLSLATQ